MIRFGVFHPTGSVRSVHCNWIAERSLRFGMTVANAFLSLSLSIDFVRVRSLEFNNRSREKISSKMISKSVSLGGRARARFGFFLSSKRRSLLMIGPKLSGEKASKLTIHWRDHFLFRCDCEPRLLRASGARATANQMAR